MSAPASNGDVAAALHEIADLLEIKGENRFRILGYRRAADAVEGVQREVCGLSERELTALPGVGKGMASKVRELCERGAIGTLDELRAEVPSSIRELTLIPGLGSKRAFLLYSELGIATIDQLREAAEQHKLSGVRGIGPKFEQEVLRAIERGVRREERVLLARALPAANEMLAQLDAHPAVVRSAVAGSVRRYRETIGDIDLLVASDAAAEVMDAFRSLSGVRSSRADGDTKASVEMSRGLNVDLRVISLSVFGAALQYFTGSAAHNVKVRQHAVRNGYRLSEYGLFDASTDALLVSATEEEVYERLGMRWIPPTMREDHGEVEAASAGTLPRVVERGDLRGDLQSHSTYSDGRLSVRDMAFAAADRGYDYFAVTDHGRRLTYMRSLSLEEIVQQRDEVRRVNEELAGRMTLLHGVELNIAADGSLDYPDEILAGFDVCVASIHGQFQLPKAAQTQRLIAAIENPWVHVIGHPSGRRLDRREGIDFDVAEVAKAAARHHVALEVNAHPHRLDLRDEHVRWAREQGAKLVISTDAHSAAELDNMHFGVGTAQRGWTQPDEVINTWPLERLRRFLAKQD